MILQLGEISFHEYSIKNTVFFFFLVLEHPSATDMCNSAVFWTEDYLSLLKNEVLKMQNTQ